MKTVAVIPARYASSRFPGKPIVDICGKPMIWWVYNQAKKVKELDDVVVATDDQRIYAVCEKYDIKCLMTSTFHDTPTARLYEVSQIIKGDKFVFIGGDEPLINPESIAAVVRVAIEGDEFAVNGMTVIKTSPQVIDFTNIKVVTDTEGYLLYASRSPIPFPKGGLDFEYKKFVGIGVFSQDALAFYNVTPKSKLERIEEMDLIRFLDKHKPVRMVDVKCNNISVDTPKDLEEVIKIIKNKQ